MTDTHEEEREDLGLPEHFTTEAIDLISGVLDDLDEADEEPDAFLWGALMQAGNLISTADALDEVARAADFITTGSQGQEILHPAVQQARTARVEAAKIVTTLRGKPETRHRLTGGAGGTAAKAAAARWGQARNGGRSRKGR